MVGFDEFDARVREAKRKAIEDNVKKAKESGNKLSQTIDEEGNLIGLGNTTIERNLGLGEEVSNADIRKELFEGEVITRGSAVKDAMDRGLISKENVKIEKKD